VEPETAKSASGSFFKFSRKIESEKQPKQHRMSTLTLTNNSYVRLTPDSTVARRIESIDLLRGIVMIIMALDHVRHFFHKPAYFYEPTDLDHTTVSLFFTRWVTHFCAPVFVFLAGVSSYLYGVRKSKKEVAQYLFTRGLWLIFVELFIIGLGQTFNPTYPYFNLQVIWAIGISMIALSAMIYLNRTVMLLIAVLLVAAHNLLDHVHVQGTGGLAFLWSVLHEPSVFQFGRFHIYVMYPVLPWIGILAIGYYLGSLFSTHYDPEKRMKWLILLGFVSMELFLFLRTLNFFGDSAFWMNRQSGSLTLLSFLNVTKYPPSLLYTLMTLGPALAFLGLVNRPLNPLSKKILVFGRVPFFYYVVHIYVIHLAALIAANISGIGWFNMILSDRVNRVPELKGFGYNLLTVYLLWILLVLLMYPLCKWYYKYKRAHLPEQKWLSYM
jgi:uncharacterized membrane protein